MSDNTNIDSGNAAGVPAKGVLQKFAESEQDEKANQYDIRNERGDLVTRAYLSRYIQCNCRQGNGFVANRKENFAYFMSDAFLSECRGMTANEVGRKAAADPRWGDGPATVKAQAKALSAAAHTAKPAGATVTGATDDAPEAGSQTISKANRQRIAELTAMISALDPNDPETAPAIADAQREIEILSA